MSVLALATRDTTTMIGRCVRRTSRDVESLLTSLLLPVLLMLLFVYVFGGAMQTGMAYVDYVVPGTVLLCAGYGAASTATSVNADLSSGFVDWLRSMPVLGSSVLTGHVVASVARNLVATVVVMAVAYAIGWRPQAGPAAMVGALGLIVLFILAVSWLAAALGLVARSAESANAFTFVILFLPYLSSAFVPTSTMPGFLQGVAEHQPVTPVIETLRGLLMGSATPASTGWLAVTWCVGLGVASGLAAAALYRRRRG